MPDKLNRFHLALVLRFKCSRFACVKRISNLLHISVLHGVYGVSYSREQSFESASLHKYVVTKNLLPSNLLIF